MWRVTVVLLFLLTACSESDKKTALEIQSALSEVSSKAAETLRPSTTQWSWRIVSAQRYDRVRNARNEDAASCDRFIANNSDIASSSEISALQP